MTDAPTLGGGPPVLFAERGCPYAHRVLALAAARDIPLELRSAPVGRRPEGIERHAPSAPVPLLVHGGLVLWESRVMLEHLAAHFGPTDGLPADPVARTLHRHAMAVMDGTLARALLTGAPLEAPRLDDTIDAIAVATALAPPAPNLLAFHLAPVWRAARRWRPNAVAVRAVGARPALERWLTEAAALDSLERTAPTPEQEREDLSHARALGLLQPS